MPVALWCQNTLLAHKQQSGQQIMFTLVMANCRANFEQVGPKGNPASCSCKHSKQRHSMVRKPVLATLLSFVRLQDSYMQHAFVMAATGSASISPMLRMCAMLLKIFNFDVRLVFLLRPSLTWDVSSQWPIRMQTRHSRFPQRRLTLWISPPSSLVPTYEQSLLGSVLCEFPPCGSGRHRQSGLDLAFPCPPVLCTV